MNDGSAMLFVLLFGDPELMEGAETGQDACAEPRRVSSFGGIAGRVDFDFLVGSFDAEFVAESIRETLDERAAADEHNVTVE